MDNINQNKKITIVLPVYNEQDNILEMHKALTNFFDNNYKYYQYDLLFIDNKSLDNSRSIIRELAKNDTHVKAIFNAKNFGQFNSPYYAMINSSSDATILMACDFQDPIEVLPTFIKNWENGSKICVGQKEESSENFLLLQFKKLYYKLIQKMSNVDQIPMFTGFGLYDKSFIKILKDLDDPTPFLRGLVAEFGYDVSIVPYKQGKREHGKSSNNFLTLYDAAMLSFTSYTKMGLRIATLFGVICSVVSLIIALIYLIMKLIWWDRFAAGTIPMLIGMLFLGSIQIFFIGLVGEYILSINQRVMNRPLVIEEERVNFEV